MITQDISLYAERALTRWDTPGLSLGIARVNESGEVRTEFAGWGKATEHGDKSNAETLYSTGSCSKAFTAVSIGILMDDFANGRSVVPLPAGLQSFNWDTKVQDLFPGESDWLLADPWASAKTNIRDILTHQTGMGGHDLAYSDTDGASAVMRRMRYLKPTYEFRTRASYNNQMYMLAAHIVATYSGMPFTAFLKKRIFEPLGMYSTTCSGTEAKESGKLSHAWISNGRRVPYWFRGQGEETIAPAGGVISSVTDMAKWIAMLLNHGLNPNTSDIVVPRDVLEEVTIAHCITDATGPDEHTSIRGFGMGWVRYSYLGHEVVSHSGGIPGFSSHVAFLPSEGLGFVALSNTSRDQQTAARAIVSRAIEELLSLERASYALLEVPTTPGLGAQGTQQESRVPASLPLEQYAGTYTHAAYGSITFYTQSTHSTDGQDVIAAYAACSELVEDGSALYGAWPRMWSSHIRLRQHSKDVFLLSHSYLFPEGYGTNHAPFAYRQLGDMEVPVEFLVRDGVVGFGILDVIFDPRRKPKTDGDVEHRADVWFARSG